jgi:sugar lactone lactonase YvrE
VTRYLIAALALAIVGARAVAAQNPMERMPEVRRLIQARDARGALDLLRLIQAQVPGHPNIAFLRAHAYGVAGMLDSAEADIRRLLAWDARYAQLALRDSSVAGVRARFPQIDSLAARAARPLSTASVWATIAEPDLVAEGTAYDPSTRSVLIGSLHKYKVVAIAPDGSVSDRVAPGAGGIRSIAGIHVDSLRGILWAASNARFDTPADSTPSALFAFDARTGAFRHRVAIPATGAHFLNDITTTRDGTVFVTDSRAGRVWTARPDERTLRDFGAIGPLLAPNGITVSDNGAVVFVADADHIRGHELSTGRTWRLAQPDSVGTSGIDGLAFHGGALIAHHPLAFWRVARYPLDASLRRITGRSLIEANTPDSRTATTGEIVGDGYVFIGNSQIDRMNQRQIDVATMQPIRIYRVALPR